MVTTKTQCYEANTDENLSVQRAGCVQLDAGHICPGFLQMMQIPSVLTPELAQTWSGSGLLKRKEFEITDCNMLLTHKRVSK